VKVLVVDDEPAVRDAIGRALKLDGFEVRTAVDGRDAIRSLPDVRPDAVLLDVDMPGGGGARAAVEIREAVAPVSDRAATERGATSSGSPSTWLRATWAGASRLALPPQSG
jgi:DNA-binding response OmpR family regulator